MDFLDVCDHGDPFFGCPTCWPVEPELMPAFRGPAGDFVRSFALASEAHPIALLGTYLTIAGTASVRVRTCGSARRSIQVGCSS